MSLSSETGPIVAEQQSRSCRLHVAATIPCRSWPWAPDIAGSRAQLGHHSLAKKKKLALVVPRCACVRGCMVMVARWGGGGRPRRAGAALLGFVAFATCSSSTVACGLWQGPMSRRQKHRGPVCLPLPLLGCSCSGVLSQASMQHRMRVAWQWLWQWQGPSSIISFRR